MFRRVKCLEIYHDIGAYMMSIIQFLINMMNDLYVFPKLILYSVHPHTQPPPFSLGGLDEPAYSRELSS